METSRIFVKVKPETSLQDLNVIGLLVDNATVSEWNLQGLPSDDLSIQNGIVVTKASRYPLLIDPQGQGKTWIQNREREQQLQVKTQNRQSQNAICPLLVRSTNLFCVSGDVSQP